jgi:hypothetical protein
MQSALQNQATGVQAGTGLGNVTNQNIGTQLTAGNTQMNAPFQNLGSYANLINDISVPGTVTQQNQMSPLSQIGAVSTAGNSLLNALGLGSALTNVGKNLGDWFTKTSTPGLGQTTDAGGNVINDPTYGAGATTPVPEDMIV